MALLLALQESEFPTEHLVFDGVESMRSVASPSERRSCSGLAGMGVCASVAGAVELEEYFWPARWGHADSSTPAVSCRSVLQ